MGDERMESGVLNHTIGTVLSASGRLVSLGEAQRLVRSGAGDLKPYGDLHRWKIRVSGILAHPGLYAGIARLPAGSWQELTAFAVTAFSGEGN